MPEPEPPAPPEPEPGPAPPAVQAAAEAAAKKTAPPPPAAESAPTPPPPLPPLPPEWEVPDDELLADAPGRKPDFGDSMSLDGDDRPPLHPPLDEPPSDDDDDPDAVLARRRERLAQAGLERAPVAPKKRRSLAWIGWLLLFGLIGAVIGGGYEKRAELVGFYPPLAKLYEQLGIPVDPAEWLGLELHNLKSSTVLEGGQTRIAVSGEVVNVGDSDRAVPAIRVAMRGAGGQELAAYTLTLDQPTVAAGETISFDVKLQAPKDEVTDLEVAFASQPTQ